MIEQLWGISATFLLLGYMLYKRISELEERVQQLEHDLALVVKACKIMASPIQDKEQNQ